MGFQPEQGDWAGRGLAHSSIKHFYGGEIVSYLNREPDAATFRRKYYYNTRQNVLYVKVITINKPEEGVIKAYWKPANKIAP